MSRGEVTRATILEHASGLASQVGLEGLTIGRLANDLDLSKSGLFAHFQSKETLQLQVLEHAALRFVETVSRPAIALPRGEARLRAVFEGWIDWPSSSGLKGGCFFVAAAAELDDRPGPVRDRLVELQRDWFAFLAKAVRIAIEEGQFRSDVDPEQFAQDAYGILLAYHHASRLLQEPKAAERAKRAFDNLILAARAPQA